VTDDDRTFQAGCLHQAVDLISDVLHRDRLALALVVSGQVDREARHRVAEPVDDRLPDSPTEGQPVHEHDRPAIAAGNGDATSIPTRTHIGKIPSLDLAHQERQIRAVHV
jgi:hypothetical protein